jgi:hypothetical protein
VTLGEGRRPSRSLRPRGGSLDGLRRMGDIDVGGKGCCGEGPWRASHVYVVTAQLVRGPVGEPQSVAVPAMF